MDYVVGSYTVADIMSVRGINTSYRVNKDSDAYLRKRLTSLQKRNNRKVNLDWAEDNPKSFNNWKEWVQITCPSESMKDYDVDKDVILFGNREYGPMSSILLSQAENRIVAYEGTGANGLPTNIQFGDDKIGPYYKLRGVDMTVPVAKLTNPATGNVVIVQDKVTMTAKERRKWWLDYTNFDKKFYVFEEYDGKSAIQACYELSIKQKLVTKALEIIKVGPPIEFGIRMFDWCQWNIANQDCMKEHDLYYPHYDEDDPTKFSLDISDAAKHIIYLFEKDPLKADFITTIITTARNNEAKRADRKELNKAGFYFPTLTTDML